MQVGCPSEPPTLTLCENLEQFFRDILTQVRERHECSMSQAAEVYLGSLLCTHAHQSAPVQFTERPLTTLLEGALSHAGPGRFDELRRIGDALLYTTGFFGDHLKRRGHTIDMLQQLGAQAYRSAGRAMAAAPGTIDLFEELSQRFVQFAAVLAEVADTLRASAIHSNSGLMDVYERWLRSGSAALAEALASSGVLPSRATRDSGQPRPAGPTLATDLLIKGYDI